MKKLALWFLFVCSIDCAQPKPVPVPPGPTPAPAVDASPPADAPLPLLFSGQIYDCRLPVVASEYQLATSAIRGCLAAAAVPACLVEKASQYNPATVACLARDLGNTANAAVLAGSTDMADAIVANAARSFITTQNLGYK